MSKFNEEMSIDCLPAVVHKQLVDELNKDHSWNQLAKHISEQLGYVGSTWIKSLDDDGSNKSKTTPTDALLDHLSMRMCTVGVLCDLLANCNLNRALSILHLPEPLTIIVHPNATETDTAIELNKIFKLKCRATGLPPPSYTWYHENLALDDENKAELNIYINNIDQEGEYKCLISQIDNGGVCIDQKFTESVYLTIKPTPVIIKTQPTPFVEVKYDGILRLSCQVESHPPPKFQWFQDNTKLDSQIFNILEIERFREKNEGKYYCYITNEVSQVYTERCNVVVDLPREKAVAKIALLIANEDYDCHEKLKTPKHDVAKMAQLLEDIGFHVICLINLTIDQMKNAMRIFCAALSEGVYGIFYFAGHGFKMQESYMLAVDAPKSFLRSDAICESELLAMIVPRDPALLVIILDTCQTVPPREVNPEIHNEVPTVNEYKSRKNLRNLIQAYSTSSHRPSYERSSNDCGLYVTHLSKYITRDISVKKVFEETGKSIDIWFKGKERNQIPMFALTVTKPFRLTDAIYAGEPPDSIKKIKTLIAITTKTVDLIFKQSGINCKLVISQATKPYLNLIKLNLTGVDHLTSNFYNSVAIERNNLFQSSRRNEFRVHNPQINKGPLVISIERDGHSIGATLFPLLDHIPLILRKL